MNLLCQVNCCNNQGIIPGVTYHKFPKTVAELWFCVHSIPIRKVENVTEMIVCSDHFKLDDYIDTEGKMKLKNGAIPSLYLKISKADATEPNILQSVLSSNGEDTTCIESPIKVDIKQINNPQLPSKPEKMLKVTVLQKNNNTPLVEKFVDKNIEFTDIIAIADESDMLTAINSMHNYSISAETRVNTEQQNQVLPEEQSTQVRNNLFNEKQHRPKVKKIASFKNRPKLRNKKENIKILRNKKVASNLKNTEKNIYRADEEEMIENIILDHDYTTLEENVNSGAAEVHAYNIICSENYVWKLKRQLGLYSRKTRSLRKRLDSLKSVVDVLKKRIL